MIEILKVSQVAFSALIVLLVLLQPKDAGLSAGLSGSAAGQAKFERRGAAKGLHLLTVAVALLFTANSVAYFLLAS